MSKEEDTTSSPYHVVRTGTRDSAGREQYLVTLTSDESQIVTEVPLTRPDAVFVVLCLNTGQTSPALDAILDGRIPTSTVVN